MPVNLDFSKMSRETKLRILDLYAHQAKNAEHNHIDTYFTDTGEKSRTAYGKYMPFFSAGKTHKHRLIMAGNRTGKSLLTCYELVCHLTGQYPAWWDGKRLDNPQNWWVVGENTKLLRQSIIPTLLGPIGNYGTGLIRHSLLDFETITDTTKVSTSITALRVKHISGKFCEVNFKTYEMGRTAFQAAAVNVVFDEEPPVDIYTECVTRTATLGDDAITIMNFTPLKGAGTLITGFLEGNAITTGEINNIKHLTHLVWDDAPHLSQETKDELAAMYPAYIRDARIKGLPVLGEGAVYPIDLDNVIITPLPFSIPKNWKRFAGLDFGFNDPTVVLWFAVDPDGGCMYVYAEHYLAKALVSTHAEAIRAKNRLAEFFIPIVCDPSGGGRNSNDGVQTRHLYYTEHQIPMTTAINSIELGIAAVMEKMSAGNLKIYSTCVNTIRELRAYSRHKDSFKGDDHAMDALRYGVMSGMKVATSLEVIEHKQELKDREQNFDYHSFNSSTNWMNI